MNAVTQIEASSTPFTPALFAAMAKAFPKIEGALKDTDNEAFKRGGKAHKYADLSSVVAAVKPALAENGLFFAQITHEQPGGVCVETLVCHEGGESMSFGRLFVPATKQDAQGYGSALTYCRRYSLMAAFGVCPEDDDGNAAAQNQRNEMADRNEQGREQGMPDAAWAKLANLLKATNTAAGTLIDHYKVKDLRHLNERQYADAIDRLEQRLADAAKAETNRTGSQSDTGFALDDEIKF